MGENAENKAERVLAIYTRLRQGKVVYKEEMSKSYGVSARTIQRDLADVQCFLENQGMETGDVQEIVFDKQSGGYILQTKQKNHLDGKEILAISKVLLESRALVKSEMFPIIHNLIELCGNDAEIPVTKELLRNEMHHYVELRHGKQLLNRLWDLEQAVRGQKYVKIRYRKLKNQEIVERKVKPVGVMFSEFYFYLTAYLEDINKEETFRNPDDPYPTIYRLDRLLDYTILNERFRVPYAERFEEGEFRKRVQFMYGGRLRKIKFKYKGNSLDSILDRLPTAEVVEKENDGVVVQAEVFGDGVEMWLRGLGEWVEM